MNNFKTSDLFNCKDKYLCTIFEQCEYPWEVLLKLKNHIERLIDAGIDGFSEYSRGILVGENVEISPLATLEPPAIIAENTIIRPGAYIRGNVIIGKNCVIGNSTEVKNSILLDNIQIPHFNYVGDSILGNNSHMGAGVICSNLKADGKNVTVGKSKIDTGLRKLGAFLGDGSDIGCNCVLNPGTVIGKNTSVYPLTSLRGVYPSDSIVKSNENIVLRREKEECVE